MAKLSCGMKFLKFLLFFFNFIVWVCGVVVLGVGIYSRVKISDWKSLLNESTIPNAANIMIAAGCFVMIIGFMGCCGAWKENKCLLVSYAITLIGIFVLEIAAGIFAYTRKSQVMDSLTVGLGKAIQYSYGKSDYSSKGLTESVDWFQQNIQCCGVDRPDDWLASAWFNATNKAPVPASCCVRVSDACNNETLSNLKRSSAIYLKGCVPAGEQYIKDNLWKIGGVGVGIAFVQIVGIVFAILLCRSITYEKV